MKRIAKKRKAASEVKRLPMSAEVIAELSGETVHPYIRGAMLGFVGGLDDGDQLKVMRTVVDKLRGDVQKMESKAAEALIKPLIGTCYKVAERYAGSSRARDRYFIYYRVRKVEGNHVTYLRFEVNPRGHVEIEPNHLSSTYATRYARITLAEFHRAWNRMLLPFARVKI